MTAARDNGHAGQVVEAPPATQQRAPTVEERRQTIRDVSAMLDQRHDRDGNPTGPRRTLLNLDRIVKRDAWFRRRLAYNGLSEVVEWQGARMRDEDVTRIRLAIARDYGVEFSAESTQQVLTETARQLTYHPVVRYLRGLLWDETPRIDRFLVDYLGVEDNPLHRAMSRRWFVSCCARAFGKGEKAVKVDTVLILAGPQGARKSTAFRVLAGEDWFSDTALDIRNKDAYQAIRGVWVYELAELAATRPRDAESVKAFLSAPTDRYRPPYGRNVVESHRQCVFVGTTNEGTFLSDPTGARRFWPVSVGAIDLDRIRADRDMLWAEAVAAYAAGEVWWLDRAQDDELTEAQEQYQHEDPWETVLERWIDASPENRAQAGRGMNVGELLIQAIEMDPDRQKKGDEMRLSAILHGKGWRKRRTRRGKSHVRVWVPPA